MTSMSRLRVEQPSPDHAVMADQLPLTTLLSRVLVAFTIEFDNELEHRMPHRTTDHNWTASLEQKSAERFGAAEVARFGRPWNP